MRVDAFLNAFDAIAASVGLAQTPQKIAQLHSKGKKALTVADISHGSICLILDSWDGSGTDLGQVNSREMSVWDGWDGYFDFLLHALHAPARV